MKTKLLLLICLLCACHPVDKTITVELKNGETIEARPASEKWIEVARWRQFGTRVPVGDPSPTITNYLTVTNYTVATIPATTKSKTNIVDNGLGAWLAETNHSFGPRFAKSIYILQLPDGKFYIRWKDCDSTNQEFQTLFVSDIAHQTASDARDALSLNMNLRIKKAASDAIEDAFK